MKKIVLILTVFYSVNFLSQTVQSTCTAPDSIYFKYREDANKMAIRRVYYIGSSYKDSIVINKQIRDNYLKALIAVYNATAIPARDSVVKIFNIHIYGNNVSDVSIRADSNLQWVKNIKYNVLPCGNVKMDYLLNKYFLKKTAQYPNLISPKIDLIFHTDTNCNTQVLADTLRTMPGIFLADGSNGSYGSGNKIEDSLTTNYTWLVYSYGWGDCLNGCLYRKFWQFKVYNDCSVEYGGTFGAPLNVGISENNLEEGNINVYPNPAREKLNIEFSSLESSEIKLELINSLGHVLLTYNNLVKKQEINLIDFPPGFYFLKIQSGQTYRFFKIIRD